MDLDYFNGELVSFGYAKVSKAMWKRMVGNKEHPKGIKCDCV